MAKNEKTPETVASKAPKILKNPKSTAAEKPVAASALTLAKDKPAVGAWSHRGKDPDLGGSLCE